MTRANIEPVAGQSEVNFESRFLDLRRKQLFQLVILFLSQLFKLVKHLTQVAFFFNANTFKLFKKIFNNSFCTQILNAEGFQRISIGGFKGFDLVGILIYFGLHYDTFFRFFCDSYSASKSKNSCSTYLEAEMLRAFASSFIVFMTSAGK